MSPFPPESGSLEEQLETADNYNVLLDYYSNEEYIEDCKKQIENQCSNLEALVQAHFQMQQCGYQFPAGAVAIAATMLPHLNKIIGDEIAKRIDEGKITPYEIEEAKRAAKEQLQM